MILLLVITIYLAWRYSKTEADPDWALFNMAAFTGSWYGRDFADCKPPAIHLWYYALAKIVGTDVRRVKFAHHFSVGLGGIIVMYLTNSFWNGLAFTVLVNSAWMYAFHGNVGQIPALMLVPAIAGVNEWVSVVCLGIAVFFEPKLILPAVALVVMGGMWTAAAVYAMVAFILILFLPRDWIRWTWEGSFTIPKRMGIQRAKHKLYEWNPWYTAFTLQYTFPWAFLGALSMPAALYWLPAALYAILVGYSKAVRPNHMLPLAAWIACAGIHPYAVLALVAWDFVSCGFYLGDIWGRHYAGLRDTNIAAREIGQFVNNIPGSLWVNDYHTAIYVYARKQCAWGLTEQVEMNAVLDERRQHLLQKFEKQPADIVIVGPKPGAKFSKAGYKLTAKHRSGYYEVYKKE